MNNRYRFRAMTHMGHCTEFEIEERSESIASVEAKIHVERWLAGNRTPLASLVSFDLLSVTP